MKIRSFSCLLKLTYFGEGKPEKNNSTFLEIIGD